MMLKHSCHKLVGIAECVFGQLISCLTLKWRFVPTLECIPSSWKTLEQLIKYKLTGFVGCTNQLAS
jgi:hypothetical protein